MRLPLRLAEANPVSGGLRFEMVDGKADGRPRSVATAARDQAARATGEHPASGQEAKGGSLGGKVGYRNQRGRIDGSRDWGDRGGGGAGRRVVVSHFMAANAVSADKAFVRARPPCRSGSLTRCAMRT